jgi:hypothetical protein
MTTRPPPRPRGRAAIARLQSQEIRERERRSEAFTTLLSAWLRKYGRWQEKRVRALLESGGLEAGLRFEKAQVSQETLDRELRDLYTRFGLQQIQASGERWSASLGTDFVLKPEAKFRHAREVENKVVLLFRNTEQMVRDSLQTIITDALSEFPRPTIGEVTRRIARQWHGEPTSDQIARGSEAERLATAEWQRRQREGLPPSPRVALALENIREGEQEALFSPARANAIARTELGDADTAGALEGFSVSGVEKARWLARPNDGRSSERKHYKMNSHRALPIAGLMSGDRERWFKLPSGARARRPLDPLLPVGERVNCRCVLLPSR